MSGRFDPRSASSTRDSHLRRLTARVILLGAATLVLLLAACGSSSKSSSTAAQASTGSSTPTTKTASTAATASTQTSTSAARSSEAVAAEAEADITLSSPALPAGNNHELAKRYTCDGANVSLPVRWSKIPAGTAELALFVINPAQGVPLVDWGVAGLKPTLRGLTAGRLPAGAVVGRNSQRKIGYSVCPPKGQRQPIIVELLALPHKLGAKQGFGSAALRRRALKLAKHAGVLLGGYKRP